MNILSKEQLIDCMKSVFKIQGFKKTKQHGEKQQMI